MGAVAINEFVSIEKASDAAEAWRILHDRDLVKYGNRGYTGSWAEVPGVVNRPSTSKPMLLEEAGRYARTPLRNETGPAKWDAAHYVPVYAPGRSRSFKVVLDDEQRRQCVRPGWDGSHTVILEHLVDIVDGKLRDGEQVVSAEAGTPTSKVSVKMSSPSGTVETRFFVLYSDSPGDFTWERGYRSQAEARKALDTRLKGYNPERTNVSDLSGEIVAVRRRENGQPLVTGTRKVSQKVPVTVTVASVSDRLIGWYLYAVASC